MSNTNVTNTRILKIAIGLLALIFITVCYNLYSSIREEGYLTIEAAKEYDDNHGVPQLNISEINFSESIPIVMEVDN